jgi:Tfp pilus assembly protein PilP
MSTHSAKRFLALGAVLWAAGPALAAAQDEILFQPPAVYQSQTRRDPFVQPAAGRLNNILPRLDIDSLKLTGVISHPHRSLALFTAQTGPRFGYLLKEGKLYGENHRLVSGVTGQVLNSEQVILKQGNRRIVFKMR